MTVTALDWNQWRNDYDEMSFADHQAFNAEAARLHPEQRCWDAEACATFLEERRPASVVELGGWDGSLAAEMLARFPSIRSWTNFDITPDVPQACDDPRYLRRVLTNWPWRLAPKADALVASHVFEHMRMREVEWLLDRWDVDSVYVDIPISGPPNWDGYTGSHIIEAGVGEFLTRMDALGFDIAHSAPGLIAYLDRRPS